MDINTLLSTVVLVSFIVTIILAVGSYLAFKGREVRRPDPGNGEPQRRAGLLRADLSASEAARGRGARSASVVGWSRLAGYTA
jgi:hypothetical protein